eukprot:8446416-Ditylum_brightwellii.AAC.1
MSMPKFHAMPDLPVRASGQDLLADVAARMPGSELVTSACEESSWLATEKSLNSCLLLACHHHFCQQLSAHHIHNCALPCAAWCLLEWFQGLLLDLEILKLHCKTC